MWVWGLACAPSAASRAACACCAIRCVVPYASCNNADGLIALLLQASGNSVAAYWTTLFASYIEKAGGVKKFLGAPGGGGGAAPAGTCHHMDV